MAMHVQNIQSMRVCGYYIFNVVDAAAAAKPLVSAGICSVNINEMS